MPANAGNGSAAADDAATDDARAGRAIPPLPGLVRAIAAGYLTGTIPCADTVARLASGGSADLRNQGSGNPGAVNAMSVLGKGWGWSILVADVAKGAMACRLGARLGGERGAHLAGTAAVIGHCYPVWKQFRGGKGVAVSLGQCLATFPAYLPIDLGVSWVVGRWRGRALPGTAAGSATWVLAGLLWWRRGWPNPWGPGFERTRGPASPLLPFAAALSSAVILRRFAAAQESSASKDTAADAHAASPANIHAVSPADETVG